MEDRTKGILSCCAGFLFHMIIGAMIIWGNITVYVTSYLRLYNSVLTSDDSFFLLPLIMISLNFTMQLRTYLIHTMPPRLMIIISTVSVGSGLLISSFITNFYCFTFFYAIFWGFANGFSYMTSTVVAWGYLPAHQGLVTGIIFCSSGISSAMFNIIGSHILNSDNWTPDDQSEN